MFAFSQIAQGADRAKGVVGATGKAVVGAIALRDVLQSLESPDPHVRTWVCELMGTLPGLLESPDPHVLRWTCELIGTLVCKEAAISAILELKPCVRLVSLSMDEDLMVNQAATYALSQIARWVDGARAVAEAEEHWGQRHTANSEISDHTPNNSLELNAL
ncbi:hypothetical protein K438DRAFT_1967689 [Mycena galopus ATCC 62051]|nr:hypothetical protein K438DRAFT_1967689 [Mycena galopus ATCC 62051]